MRRRKPSLEDGWGKALLGPVPRRPSTQPTPRCSAAARTSQTAATAHGSQWRYIFSGETRIANFFSSTTQKKATKALLPATIFSHFIHRVWAQQCVQCRRDPSVRLCWPLVAVLFPWVTQSFEHTCQHQEGRAQQFSSWYYHSRGRAMPCQKAGAVKQ